MQVAVWTCLLAVASYLHVSLNWLAVLVFVALSVTLGSLIIYYGKRLVIGSSYIERCCRETEDRILDLTKRL